MEKKNLDILPGGILPVLHCSQGDIGRQFQINLFSDNTPYVLDGTEELTIDGKKEDNNIFSYTLPATTGSTLTISTEEQMTACAGNVVCEIRIYKDDTRIGTCNFILQVEEGVSNGNPSESTLQALDAIRAELQQAVADAEEYNNQSKSWAVGPSGTGSGTDTNNSKYYSEQSSNSATNSANSATDSSNSATDSKNWAVGPSGTGTGTDTNNSKYYAQQSASSANDSSGYATNSYNSASASASSATDSKNWAVGPSGTGSGTDSNNAKYYSDQSSNSATNASNSANSASGSATDSKNWAVGPSGSGSGTDSNNAKYYAQQASDDATAAGNAKSQAQAAQQAIENMTATATQLSEGATPTVNKTTVGGVVNLEFGIPKGDTGSTGATGADGVSPSVAVASITGGHSVTITDKDHPTGQTFNVMDGEDGLGVPSGGTTGQVLAKASNSDNDTEWITPSGGGGSDSKTRIGLGAGKLVQVDNTKAKTFYGRNVWSDGTNVYLYRTGSGPGDSESNYYVQKENASGIYWEVGGTLSSIGLPSFDGEFIWYNPYDKSYYLSDEANSRSYKYNKDTGIWTSDNNYTNIAGNNVWTDGINVYCSYGSVIQQIMNMSTGLFYSISWTGLTAFDGKYIWTDGIDTYYDYNGDSYKLVPNSTDWEVNGWEDRNNNTISIDGSNVWSDGIDVYYTDGTSHYRLNRHTYKWESIYLVPNDFGTSRYGKDVFLATDGHYYITTSNHSGTLYKYIQLQDKYKVNARTI